MAAPFGAGLVAPVFARVCANSASSLSSATCRAGSPGSCGRVIHSELVGAERAVATVRPYTPAAPDDATPAWSRVSIAPRPGRTPPEAAAPPPRLPCRPSRSTSGGAIPACRQTDGGSQMQAAHSPRLPSTGGTRAAGAVLLAVAAAMFAIAGAGSQGPGSQGPGRQLVACRRRGHRRNGLAERRRLRAEQRDPGILFVGGAFTSAGGQSQGGVLRELERHEVVAGRLAGAERRGQRDRLQPRQGLRRRPVHERRRQPERRLPRGLGRRRAGSRSATRHGPAVRRQRRRPPDHRLDPLRRRARSGTAPASRPPTTCSPAT